MKVAIILSGSHGGALDQRTVEVDQDGQDNLEAVIGAAVASAVSEWTLNVGDAINIVEQED